MRRTAFLLVMASLLVSCGGGAAGEPELMGEELFAEIVVGGKAGCTSCHSIDPADDGIGPSLAGVGSIAAERVSGMSGSDYLREAIVSPDSFVVDGYDRGVMPEGWDLSDVQIDSLVEYLLGLE